MRSARLAALVIALAGTMFSVAAAPAAAAAVHVQAALSAPAHPAAPAAPAGQAGQCCGMHLHAHLSGSSAYPGAYGSADYHRDCCHREFTVRVSGISSLAGKTLAVWAHGTKVGTATVSSGGSFYFHRSGSAAPRLAAGDKVAVKRTSGTLVASGTLRRMCC